MQTSNFYLAAATAFMRWMARDGRAPLNSPAGLKKGDVRRDRRHDRRALDADPPAPASVAG